MPYFVFSDVFLPCPGSLLVNLQQSKDLVIELLQQLPTMFENNMETGSALGAALQAAYKLMVSYYLIIYMSIVHDPLLPVMSKHFYHNIIVITCFMLS